MSQAALICEAAKYNSSQNTYCKLYNIMIYCYLIFIS